MATLCPTEDETDEAFRKNSAKLFKVFMANANDNHIVRVHKIKDVPNNKDGSNNRTSIVVQDTVPSLADALPEIHNDETDGPNNETEKKNLEKKNEVEPNCKKAINLGTDSGNQISIRIQALLSNPENGKEPGTPFFKELHGVEHSTGFIFTNEMDVLKAKKGHFVRNWWVAENGTNFKRQESLEKRQQSEEK